MSIAARRFRESDGDMVELKSSESTDGLAVQHFKIDPGEPVSFYQGQTNVASAGTAVQLWAGVAQRFTIVTVADVSSSLAGTAMPFSDADGPVQLVITVDGEGDVPDAPDGGRNIVVDISEDDANTAVADAIATAIDADSKFSASNTDHTVTVIASTAGVRDTPTHGDTGFTVAVTVAGEAVERLVDEVEIHGRKSLISENTGNIYVGFSEDSQLRVVEKNTSVILPAPYGRKIDLSEIWIDAATNADGATYTAMT